MLVSTVDGKLSHRLHCRDSSLDTNLGTKAVGLPKFSLNLKNYCSIHLRLLHSLNEDRRHDIFMLNPECHIKFLEENLNFLSRKPSRCNDFKINSSRSSSYSVKTSQNVFSLPENKLPSLTFTSLSEGSVSELKTIERKLDNGNCMDSGVYDGSNIKILNVHEQKRPVDKLFPLTPPIVKIKEKYSSKNDGYNKFQPIRSQKPINMDKTAENLKNKTDSDNHFEFTVAEENIVSFVCSPPSSRKQSMKESESNYICDSDEESMYCSSKGSSETGSNASSRSSYSKYIKTHAREQMAKTNTLLWHPPSTLRNVVPISERNAIQNRPSCNRQSKQKPIENCINFFGSINSLFAVTSTSNRSFKNCHNQETVMFRETALRGCYDIETLLKEIKSASPEVEKEVSQTREAIFSAVRLRRSNDSIVSDSVQSIVDICNCWIKLNAHFERKDFKQFLETNGVDLTIFGDFSQWQCMSRIFVDKLINVLKKVSLDKDSKAPRQHDAIVARVSDMATMRSNVEISSDNPPSNMPRAVQSLNTSADAQGKRWKQRRFQCEKTDPEKVAFPIDRPCGSTFSGDGCIHNSFLGNNCNPETVFGQGDSGLNLNRDVSKLNVFPTKNGQFAQGDVNVFFNGSKHCSNTVFFDKNISEPNMKCSSLKCETNVCPISSENELCPPLTNLVDTPLNNFFPVSIQQIVPTVPPLYNSQHCPANINQFQPGLNHSLAKPNPIHCIDSDMGENFIQSCYMKPGHYAPPQKPASYQKSVNNTIPIEDIPAVGIPFLYSAPYASSQQQPKNLELPNGLPQIQMPKDNSKSKNSDVTWETALSMAGQFRDTMIADRNNDCPKLKMSEMAPLKSHFLLSDGNSQNSSSSGDSFKFNSDNDEQSPSTSNNYSNIDIPVTKSKAKTTDWLVGSLNKLSLENDNSSRCSVQEKNKLFKSEQSQVCEKNVELKKNDRNESYFPSNFATANSFDGFGHVRDCNNFSKNEDVLIPFMKTEAGYLQKKTRKAKKGREEFSFFDRKTPMHISKPEKMVFTRSVNNKITAQLEEILNCIWNTNVATLIEEEINSEKELTRLEQKMKSPLYLQAMRCKLNNHSYDTLDQALSDFQQYFADIRNKSKGDKHCLAAVGALELMFLGLVEKHFGLLYHSQPRHAVAPPPTPKGRRLNKKPQRRL